MGSRPSARPTSWGRCRTGIFSSRPTTASRERLLEVEVEVAQRAGRHDAVGVGVDGVAEMAAGLACSDAVLFIVMIGKPQHLCEPGVVDHGAAERVDHLLEVAMARMVVIDAEPLGRPHDVAAVEGPDAEVGERAADFWRRRETDVLDEKREDPGRTMWRPKPSSLGERPRASPTSWGGAGPASQLAADDGLGERLLEVEVQMAERAGRHDAVGVGVGRVAEVAARPGAATPSCSS